MPTERLTFVTTVPTSVDEIWSWSTSIRGIQAEMWPILKITFPKALKQIDKDTALGKPLCRCHFLLLGVFPMDMSKLTFVELEPGHRFVEQSPLFSMHLWRHERVVAATSAGATVTDNLEFSPRFASPLVKWFVKLFFQHRHSVLSRTFADKHATSPAR